ncbi:hypothetical protein KGD82_25455 [Nocardiopsis eucommiae]|uniref:Uncharacterized protein n=1 Tax=Nocardiopsis eucommiae TaxID=2831970 RepID=A0A975L8E9_9ACTN|nr:hypothetical protein KGD82_25455 [Nocardiopsis eucommiae]
MTTMQLMDKAILEELNSAFEETERADSTADTSEDLTFEITAGRCPSKT